jgi:uncharacterized protein YkwD
MRASLPLSSRVLAWVLGAAVLTVVPAVARADVATDATELAVVSLINAQRAANGLNALALDDRLSTLAEMHSLDMATNGCFQHDSCDGTSWATRMQSQYPGGAMGEIIAAGYSTAGSVVDSWMNSPGHQAQILTPGYQGLGVSLVKGGGQYGTYWTVDFGSLKPVSATPAVPESSTLVLMGLGLTGVALVRRRA